MKVFIDGKVGTTGLRIYTRLEERSDVELISLSEENRKKPEARKEALNACDVAFLCLPDAAAEEAVAMIENDHTKVLDTSTAHRTAAGWAYGFPELSKKHFDNVVNGKRIAVPGCYASGFISLVYPLIEAGVLSPEALLTCHAVSGYSGGGKSMIADYAAEGRPEALDAPRQYGIAQKHKHLPEMSAVTGLATLPVFCPSVADFYSGMTVTVPLFKSQLQKGATVETVKELYKAKYAGPVVTYAEAVGENGFIAANLLSGKDCMKVTVEGNADRILLISCFDNLGKGASGAAVQCMNLITGCEQTLGLSL